MSQLVLTSLTRSSLTTSSVTINYSLTNSLTTSATVYLYRFIGNTIPSTNPTSGTSYVQLTSVTVSASSTLNSQTYTNNSLIKNTVYTYAFYTGTGTTSTIITNSLGVEQSITILTAPHVVQTTDIGIITYNSNNYLTLIYRLSNYYASATSYLYRFVGSTAPTTLDTSIGTMIISSGTSSSNSTLFDTGLTSNTQYTYAFYNGNSNGVSTILYSGSSISTGVTFPLVAWTLTGYTTNQIITNLSANKYNNSVHMNYTITNNSASQTATVYLYRFTSIPPSTLSGGSNVSITINTINSGDTLTGIKSNTGLTASTQYYYAFYNGNTTGKSTILTNSLSEAQYISALTTGVSQSLISVSSISAKSATINYNISNAASSGTATLYLYYYKNITTSTAILNKAISTQVTNGSSPTIPIILTASSSSNSSINLTGLTANTIYSVEFYNGNNNGSSPILTDSTSTGGTLQFISFTTAVLDTSISNSNVLNNSATISYTISNINNSDISSYLYRYLGSLAPSTLTNSGTQLTTVVTNSGTNAVPTVNTSTYSSTGLDSNSTYTYAFYNGTTNDISTILTTAEGTPSSTSFTTSNLFNTSIISSSVTITSVIISYTFTNNSVSKTVYLYRFAGSSAPATNPTNGTLLTTELVTSSGVISTYNDAGLTANTTYTYAFYDGNINDSSIIFADINNNGQYIIVTTQNIYVTNFTLPYTYETSIVIFYDINNPNSSTVILYIYRFNGSTSPSILDNTGTLISTITIAPNNSSSTTFTDTDSILSNNVYTYAIYTGNTIGTSNILTINSTTYYLTTFTFGIGSTLTYSTVTNTSANILYKIVNNLASNINVYLYRFNGSSVPSPISSGTQITTFNINSNSTVDSNIVDTTLNPVTMYTYAFLNNTIGSTSAPSNILNETYTPVSTTLTTTGDSCFVKNTKILCYIDDKEVYLPIEDLKVGIMVKTYRHGYKKIIIKGHALMQNTVLYNRKKIYAMYKNEKNNLNEDLYVTGGHSLLVDNLTGDEIKNTYKYWKKLLKIEDKYLIMACVNNNFVQIDDNNIYDIYQIVLENDNYKNNYGIYANGVLTESISEHTFNRRKHLISIE